MVSDVYCDARTINIEQEVIRREKREWEGGEKKKKKRERAREEKLRGQKRQTIIHFFLFINSCNHNPK
jgi:hypothetical protein